jgi:protein phosphatase
MHYDAYALTDVGCVREHNEDDLLLLPDEGVYIVADGKVASRISVESVRAFYADPEALARTRRTFTETWRRDRNGAVTSPNELRLRSAVEYGNARIFDEASSDPNLEDMGTTIVGAAFVGSRCYIAHVGDSRAYRYREQRLLQLTEDHSLANEYIRMRVLKPEDLPHFPYKNVIVRALGLQHDVVVDTQARTCRPGDRYLLCSDGLTDLVTDEEIYDVLATIPGARPAAEELVRRAIAYGGVDNVTVLIIDAHATAPAAA